jgi:L-fuculose-phosphate aldolase
VKHRRARRIVAELYQELGHRGLILGSSGNVSLRIRDGMVITPSGGSPLGVGAKDLAAMSLDGDAPGDVTPSSEWPMHAAIYRTAPEAECIIHTHADACTALACLHEPLPAFHYMVLQFGGSTVPCAPYVTFGTPALAALAADTIQGHGGCLLANHGMIVHGRDAGHALDRALLLEALCRQYLIARSAGTPRLLTEDEMAAARERFRTYGQRHAAAAL